MTNKPSSFNSLPDRHNVPLRPFDTPRAVLRYHGELWWEGFKKRHPLAHRRLFVLHAVLTGRA